MKFHSATRRCLPLIVILLLLSSASFATHIPKNIIFLIGDGMGIGAITTGRWQAGGTLAMDTMPVVGLVKNQPARGVVTDSAASATALATGVKTNNGMVSMDPSGNKLRTILEVARDMGKATGIISTASIVDATPACFGSHAKNRSEGDWIADQLIISRADVILGGGRRFFMPASTEGGSRKDGRDLVAEAVRNDYAVYLSADDMRKSKANKVLGLFSMDNITGQPSEPSLEEMNECAYSILGKSEKGFFMMSEGALIDKYAHGNNFDGLTREMLEFDKAIQAALNYAKKHKNTLVVVTADHETGGLAALDPDDGKSKVKAGWLHGGHTGNMIAVYAMGPGSEIFGGTHENTDLPRLMARLWNCKLNEDR